MPSRGRSISWQNTPSFFGSCEPRSSRVRRRPTADLRRPAEAGVHVHGAGRGHAPLPARLGSGPHGGETRRDLRLPDPRGFGRRGCAPISCTAIRVLAAPRGSLDPERFAGASGRASGPGTSIYLFSLGPRVCVGKAFAMMEMQLVVATVAQRYRFDLLAEHPVALDPQVTLRPRHGVRVIARRPDGAALS